MAKEAQHITDQANEPEELEEWMDEYPSAMERIAQLEEEVKLLKTALYAIPAALEKEKMEIRKSLETFQTLQTRLTDISSTTAQSNQKVESLGRMVDGVKKETSSWLVISIVCFSIFFIISLFIRAG